MKSTLLVPFGLKGGKLVEPTQVPNGKGCGCFCPACNKPLVAKQNAKTPHFAHSQDDNCAKGFETAVHLAVKQIISDEMKVRLPAVVWKNPLPRAQETKRLYTERTIELQSVALEQAIGDFKPDISVKSDGATYLVEVAVTHFIDDAKQEKINARKLPTIEIDVSELKGGFTLAELTALLFDNRCYPAEWKYHPTLEELDNEAIKAEDDRIAWMEKAHQERRHKFARYKSLPPQQKLRINLKSIGLTERQMSKLTAFVAWEDSFCVPRIVWQSAALAYISKVQQEDSWDEALPCSVNSSACSDWMEDVFEILPKVKNGERIAVWKYFKHLEQVGILRFLYHKDFEIALRNDCWAELSENYTLRP